MAQCTTIMHSHSSLQCKAARVATCQKSSVSLTADFDLHAQITKLVDIQSRRMSPADEHSLACRYPYNLDFEYGALDGLQKFSINNLGDPFIASNYGVHSREFEVSLPAELHKALFWLVAFLLIPMMLHKCHILVHDAGSSFLEKYHVAIRNMVTPISKSCPQIAGIFFLQRGS